ncbi:bifunctional glycosyltransferase/CDP-glycerol:glycerophosphate glycerophosphotransferase [Paractinoplanes lichenicola]|uniref:Bifunctional glycosyltransferase family 2 protein/CDP-glycerol:glycerophosphate glycerophosphotransferase n=1 Tax=Paractinoplanes lichenicola TaxID=2802976 RepID=A0ABS1VF92_9ACTN|nr:bifunctional glycosyltransferase family 2 protein/CDP-glycerol:glycerophosphate glycerophosphotransferase [Actinoplanes lichenicola]MBL7253338.1 bifunctional glycosyltransferase family 2 protein/CDP-glycerol:glycerophosphate glycerophosphotransferase [Actinoplanes lichenicola]
MPLLSIVLPVYRVQAYLRECLDSILEQTFTDFEVIAVDDCSPDHSGAILDEYAARDSRVRVVHLEHNVGLGEARNAGLGHAFGRYVWFVDSDDWLAPGALAAIADRLRTAEPDVLVVDYAKVWWDTTTRHSKLSALVASANFPRTFTLAEQPRAIRIFHVAWNKVYNRDFLLKHDITYPTGLYEDVPVGYPVLMLADRISVLDRVCVYYRQRRRGAITSTPGRGHFQVLDQWDQLFERLDAIGERAAPFRNLVFERMLYQLLLVLENPERIARSDRKEFFRAIVRAYRRHVPAGGYQFPAGWEGVRHQVAARGSWTQWRALHNGLQLAGAAKPRLLELRNQVRLRTRLNMLYYRFQLRRPMDEQLAVYSAYWGKGYACNPRAVYERMTELAPGVRGVWEIKPGAKAEVPAGVETVTIGTRAHYRALARAKYLITNVNFHNWVAKRDGAIHLSTNHGTPAKAMGVDQLKFPAGLGDLDMDKLLRRSDRWTYSISPNAYTSEIWERAYPCNYETLETGYPRNDELVNATAADVAAARERLGLEPGQVAVAYLPTYRDYEFGRDALLNVESFADRLPAGTVLLVRVHHFDRSHVPADHPRILDVSDHPRVEDVYLAADMLITDYSSVMFDYAVLDRPIAIYAADWDKYRATRGAYLDVFTEGPGVATDDENELADMFVSGAVTGPAATSARALFRKRFCHLDDGHASERVVRRVFSDEALATAAAVVVPRQRVRQNADAII